LSFDLATDPSSAAVKGIPDLPGAEDVVGRADVLVCPGIDTANVLYKTIAAMNKFGAASLASITVGFPVPYIILSRSDSLETRLASVALCAVYAQRKGVADVKPRVADVNCRVAGAKRSGAPDELAQNSKTSGRESVVRRAAEAIGSPAEDVSLIVAELGSRTTVAAVRGGNTVDSSELDLRQITEIEQSDQDAIDAAADRVAKAIGSAFVAAGCEVDAIVLCGTLALSEPIRTALRRRVGRLAPVMVIEDTGRQTG